MLALNPELVCQFIIKAREFHAKEGVVMPAGEFTPSDDTDWAQVLADHSDDLTYQEVSEAISEMDPDQKYELIALMLVGRGDFDNDDFAVAAEAAKDIEEDHVATYLLTIPLVSDYLKEGLVQMGYKCDI